MKRETSHRCHKILAGVIIGLHVGMAMLLLFLFFPLGLVVLAACYGMWRDTFGDPTTCWD